MRVVFDTNVLIDGFADDFSASAQLIDAVRNQGLEAVVTPAVKREYQRILERLINDPAYQDRIYNFLYAAQEVKAYPVDVNIDDPEDYKILEAAAGGNADLVVSSDRHLLDIGNLGKIRIVTPQEAWQIYREEKGNDEWGGWLKGLGIKK